MDSNNNVDSDPKNNLAIVQTLYKALATGDTTTVVSLICDDLEWWFHGPPDCHHMMKMLTGKESLTSFRFEPRSVDVIDGYVIVEGWEGLHAYWVHVWTLNSNGLITQFREYFNTWLTVADLKPLGCSRYMLWQSHPGDLAKRSLPSLMFAI